MITMTSDFSEAMQARQGWSEIFKVLREKQTYTDLKFCTLQNYPSKVKKK
jgi:hypothetical protein